MINKVIKNNINKKAFTLIEITLVVAIIGLLAGVLFKTYITMSQISFRVEQQKIVNQELLFVTQTLQNLANRNNIDYKRYDDNDINLVNLK
jgi:prepilin-type N-terminal cleavage/methylation domain-containing protein